MRGPIPESLALILGVLMTISGCKTVEEGSGISAAGGPSSQISRMRDGLLACKDGGATWTVSAKLPMIWRSDFQGSADGYELTGLWFSRTGTYRQEPNQPYEFLATGTVLSAGTRTNYSLETIAREDGGIDLLRKITENNITVLDEARLPCEILAHDEVPGPPTGDFLCMGPGEASFYKSGFLFDTAAKKVYQIDIRAEGREPNHQALEVLSFAQDGAGVFFVKAEGGFMGETRGFFFELRPEDASDAGHLTVQDAILYDHDVAEFRQEGLLPPSQTREFSCVRP